ncbi:MAG: ABC transporter permease subunit [Euryarchaeota archaeon]|jgi:ABC-2 type transport system permease protein|nr:ABC transporter permease subunit [Euryarchaeota archaeon]
MSMSLLVSASALAIGYAAVVSAQNSGRMRLLMALPVGRAELIIGIFLGRTAALLGPISVAFFCIVLIGWQQFGIGSLAALVQFYGATLILAAAWIGVALGISQLAMTSVRGATVAVSIFFLTFLWRFLVESFYGIVTGQVATLGPPASGPLFFVDRLTPTGAYQVVANSILGLGNANENAVSTVRFLDPERPGNGYVAEIVFSETPVYLDPVVSLGVLLFWVFAPLAIGYSRFRKQDL